MSYLSTLTTLLTFDLLFLSLSDFSLDISFGIFSKFIPLNDSACAVHNISSSDSQKK